MGALLRRWDGCCRIFDCTFAVLVVCRKWEMRQTFSNSDTWPACVTFDASTSCTRKCRSLDWVCRFCTAGATPKVQIMLQPGGGCAARAGWCRFFRLQSRFHNALVLEFTLYSQPQRALVHILIPCPEIDLFLNRIHRIHSESLVFWAQLWQRSNLLDKPTGGDQRI